MKRSTDRLIALQFLAVAVPIAFVLLAQMLADARRAGALQHSGLRPVSGLLFQSGRPCTTVRRAPPRGTTEVRCGGR